MNHAPYYTVVYFDLITGFADPLKTARTKERAEYIRDVHFDYHLPSMMFIIETFTNDWHDIQTVAQHHLRIIKAKDKFAMFNQIEARLKAGEEIKARSEIVNKFMNYQRFRGNLSRKRIFTNKGENGKMFMYYD